MKQFVDPLLWFILLQLACLAVLRARCWMKISGAWKSAWTLLFLSLLGLAALSTPLACHSLERSLSVAVNDQGTSAPTYIFVLGGGYIPGASLDQDVLTVESARRVLTAVSWRSGYPQAKLVFAGTSGKIKNRSNERMAQLMSETAICHGAPKSHLLLESNSRNTQEHPARALEIPGITPETPIGVVTSNWHMRRAQREFRRYFSSVRINPVAAGAYSTNWLDIIPNSGSLQTSAIFLQEWVGSSWYNMLKK
ncbi:MAG: YdcF family protein [Candidatus Omnitrophica bacterium]|nr:YdcF family protein [Candidatus Omnitrophota bacterium]